MVNLKGSEKAFCVQAALPEKSVRTINFGSAARCEARLCRAVSNLRDFWAVPPVRPLASEKAGKARPPGAQPRSFLFTTTAGLSPASHRAAEPLQVSQKHFSGKAGLSNGRNGPREILEHAGRAVIVCPPDWPVTSSLRFVI